jgi:inorganic pyrophosphatase
VDTLVFCFYGAAMGCSNLDKTLPYGFSFTFEFGLVPRTVGADGDPLSLFFITKCKARNSNPWALAAVSVLWLWSKRQTHERAGKGSNPLED